MIAQGMNHFGILREYFFELALSGILSLEKV